MSAFTVHRDWSQTDLEIDRFRSSISAGHPRPVDSKGWWSGTDKNKARRINDGLSCPIALGKTQVGGEARWADTQS
ncbi:MAG: hypothetical protein ACE361_13925 [Aureliella sp.]